MGLTVEPDIVIPLMQRFAKLTWSTTACLGFGRLLYVADVVSTHFDHRLSLLRLVNRDAVVHALVRHQHLSAAVLGRMVGRPLPLGKKSAQVMFSQ